MTDTIAAEFKLLDERFRDSDGDFVVERLHTGSRKTEGPAYFPAGRYLVWSDIPNDRLLRWDETTGAVGVFRYGSGYANGNTVDRQGRLVTCEQGNRAESEFGDGRLTGGGLAVPDAGEAVPLNGLTKRRVRAIAEARALRGRSSTRSPPRTWSRCGRPARPAGATPVTPAERRGVRRASSARRPRG